MSAFVCVCVRTTACLENQIRVRFMDGRVRNRNQISKCLCQLYATQYHRGRYNVRTHNVDTVTFSVALRCACSIVHASHVHTIFHPSADLSGVYILCVCKCVFAVLAHDGQAVYTTKAPQHQQHHPSRRAFQYIFII